MTRENPPIWRRVWRAIKSTPAQEYPTEELRAVRDDLNEVLCHREGHRWQTVDVETGRTDVAGFHTFDRCARCGDSRRTPTNSTSNTSTAMPTVTESAIEDYEL